MDGRSLSSPAHLQQDDNCKTTTTTSISPKRITPMPPGREDRHYYNEGGGGGLSRGGTTQLPPASSALPGSKPHLYPSHSSSSSSSSSNIHHPYSSSSSYQQQLGIPQPKQHQTSVGQRPSAASDHQTGTSWMSIGSVGRMRGLSISSLGGTSWKSYRDSFMDAMLSKSPAPGLHASGMMGTTPSTDFAMAAGMEDKFCKNFSCCGTTLPSLHDLMQHFEELHVRMESDFGQGGRFDEEDLPFEFEGAMMMDQEHRGGRSQTPSCSSSGPMQGNAVNSSFHQAHVEGGMLSNGCLDGVMLNGMNHPEPKASFDVIKNQQIQEVRSASTSTLLPPVMSMSGISGHGAFGAMREGSTFNPSFGDSCPPTVPNHSPFYSATISSASTISHPPAKSSSFYAPSGSTAQPVSHPNVAMLPVNYASGQPVDNTTSYPIRRTHSVPSFLPGAGNISTNPNGFDSLQKHIQTPPLEMPSSHANPIYIPNIKNTHIGSGPTGRVDVSSSVMHGASYLDTPPPSLVNSAMSNMLPMAPSTVSVVSMEEDTTSNMDAMEEINTSSEDRPYKCNFPGCNKSYKNPGGIKYHMQHGHCEDTGDPEMNNILQKPYQCTFADCQKRYKNLNGLKYHIEHFHFPVNGGAVSSQ